MDGSENIRCAISGFQTDSCGLYQRYPNDKEIVKLRDCDREITPHLKHLQLVNFGNTLKTEADLICHRIGLFITNPSLSVCPYHRAKLGIDFKRGYSCCHPSHSGKGKAFRSVNSIHSKQILEDHGVLVPLGSGICYRCYTRMFSNVQNTDDNTCRTDYDNEVSTQEELETNGYRLRERRLVKNEVNPLVEISSNLDSPSSSQPLSQISSWSEENVDSTFDEFNTAVHTLSHGEISPLKFQVRSELETLMPSTLRSIKRKASETVNLFLDAIAPGQSKKLLGMIQQPSAEHECPENVQELIISLFTDTSDRSLRKQLLSMIANNHTKSQLQQLIPGLSVHAIDEARRHASKFGAGTSVQKPEFFKRQRMNKEKLDHAIDFFFDPAFHQVTAFGTKHMKMSTGLSISIPNVVRTAYHSTLVDTYLAYCQEAEFEPLSKASLYKILSECPASKRTNLKGLDNIAAEGNSSFENLIAIIDELEKSNITQTAALLECREQFQSSKLYLKTEYKLHVQKESSCADHCLNYALSDESNSNLNQICSHEHQTQCEKCSNLNTAIVQLKKLISENTDLTEEKKTELNFDIHTAEKNIGDWKCHIVRGIAQDLCRHELFQKLAEDEVVVVMDWAMKFLPLMYREKQSDWFAQKGFNWHVTVCVFKDSEDCLKHITFVHVMDSVKQDWYSVACLLQHVLSSLKKQCPRVAKAFLRSDNAGCYHCNNLWNCLSGISNNTGIKIDRYDFSESQNDWQYKLGNQVLLMRIWNQP